MRACYARALRRTCNARSVRSIGHELAPLAVPSILMPLRVFTLTLSPPVRIVSSHPRRLSISRPSGGTLLGHYESNPLQPPLTRYISAVHHSYDMPRSLTRTHSPIRAINALIDAHACKRSGGSRRIYRPTPTTTLEHRRSVARQALTGKHGIEAARAERHAIHWSVLREALPLSSSVNLGRTTNRFSTWIPWPGCRTTWKGPRCISSRDRSRSDSPAAWATPKVGETRLNDPHRSPPAVKLFLEFVFLTPNFIDRDSCWDALTLYACKGSKPADKKFLTL